MYGDFSRRTDDGATGYGNVHFQQGRPILDADLTTLGAHVEEALRQLTQDVVGLWGTAAGSHGFKVSRDERGWTVGSGFYYVHGQRVEISRPQQLTMRLEPNETGPASERLLCSNVPFHPDNRPLEPPYSVFLRTYDRSVCARQDPRLVDPALSPRVADTVVRTQTVWEVIASREPEVEQGDDLQLIPRKAWDTWHQREKTHHRRHRDRSRPVLRAELVDSPQKLRGLLRVEVYDGGALGKARLLWSTHNAATTFGYSTTQDDVIKVLGGPFDSRDALCAGMFLEHIDDATTRPGPRRGPLLQVVEVIEASPGSYQIRVDQVPPVLDHRLHPMLRRWNGELQTTNDLAQSKDSLGDSEFATVVDGVHLTFRTERNGAGFRRGDHWLVPIRTEVGGVDWPVDIDNHAAFERAHGEAVYHDAPLAYAYRDSDVECGIRIADLRSTFYGTSVWEDESIPEEPLIVRVVVDDEEAHVEVFAD